MHIQSFSAWLTIRSRWQPKSYTAILSVPCSFQFWGDKNSHGFCIDSDEIKVEQHVQIRTQEQAV